MDDRPDTSTDAGMSGSGRVEAFSDGVFAIAITLLILDLAVPPRASTPDGYLAAALGHEWPSYFAYLVSFLVIGIIWVNHHSVFARVRQVDRVVLFANLLLLLTVSAIPFPTQLLAEYLTGGAELARRGGDLQRHHARHRAVLHAVVVEYLARLPVAARAHRSADQTGRDDPLRYAATSSTWAGSGSRSSAPPPRSPCMALVAIYYCFDQLAISRSPEHNP